MSGTDLPTQEISDEMVREFNRAFNEACDHPDEMGPNDAARAGLAAALVASGYRREADVRREVARSLGIPALHALRSIPNGEIRNGCVVMDGAQVREQLRRAYLDIQTPVDEPATALEPALPLPVAAGLVCRHGWVVTDRVVDCPPNCDGLPPVNPITEESSRG